jgi:UDPglucose 6-dehydrogenase
VDEVAYAIGTDSRIGPRFLKASVGFGGSCFRKDILNLVYICRATGCTRSPTTGSGGAHERLAADAVRPRMLANMFNTVAGKRIALFGFAFKADTGDTRESAAIGVARQLLAERARWWSPTRRRSTTRGSIWPTSGRVSSSPIPTRRRPARTPSR